MTEDLIYNTIAATLDPTHRQVAEATLSQMGDMPGFVPSLLHILLMPNSDPVVSQAAAIYFKNIVGRKWDPSGFDDQQSTAVISAEDKLFVKLHILNAISVCGSRSTRF